MEHSSAFSNCPLCGADMASMDKSHPVKLLFLLWDISSIGTAQRIIAGRLLKEYGYDMLREAFLEASMRGHQTLAYVTGILKKQNQQAQIKKEQQIAKENIYKNKQMNDEPVNVEGLPAVKEFLNSLKLQPTTGSIENYKQSEDYLKKKNAFEAELLKGDK